MAVPQFNNPLTQIELAHGRYEFVLHDGGAKTLNAFFTQLDKLLKVHPRVQFIVDVRQFNGGTRQLRTLSQQLTQRPQGRIALVYDHATPFVQAFGSLLQHINPMRLTIRYYTSTEYYLSRDWIMSA